MDQVSKIKAQLYWKECIKDNVAKHLTSYKVNIKYTIMNPG